MPAFVIIPLVFLGAYLVGSIPFGLIAGYLVKGVDIREHGSRNIGATNAARVLGAKWFPVVLLLDALKGLLPTAAMWPLSARLDLMLVAACGALVGHLFPVYLKFRGGKGVATGLGVMLALTHTPETWLPLPALCALGAFALVVAIGRMISLASIGAALSLPLWYWFWTQPHTFAGQPWLGRFIFLCVCCGFVVIKHRGNIGRILKGTEPRLGRKVES